MAINLRTTSRLRFAGLFTTDDVEHWGNVEYPVIEESADDFFYTTVRRDRIDLLSYRFYGVADLWWIIAIANGINLLPSELHENMRLRCPSKSRVFTRILKGATRGEEGR